MANLTGPQRASYVQGMFARIAHRYDLMNRIMTAGQDVRWREAVIRRAGLPPGGWLLDLGAGTGDLAQEGLDQNPDSRVVAADFTLQMMQYGRSRAESGPLDWVSADALMLPFPEQRFDAVVSGFLLRNVIDLNRVLHEQYRVLKPGGIMVALDTTHPPKNLFSPVINFHLHVIIPTIGELITGERDAYAYLPESTENFLGAENLAARMVAAGFGEVGFRRLMFATVAIHWGRRARYG
jgi:demethylmenaquinone methyltransferase/2-methoxy-6-polyprenyl-1,4-benzoquinol methylase